MTIQEYNSLNKFPVELVTNTRYQAMQSGKTVYKLRKGDTFIGIRKEVIGKNDYSIIDEFGHLHYYSTCDVLDKEGA